MDYESFQAMSTDVAHAYLDRLLEVEREALTYASIGAKRSGVDFDYSLASLPRCLAWLVQDVHVNWVPLPDDVPDWMRSAHPRGSSEFDDDSKSILLRTGYYLGECFARLPGFHWTVGDSEYMQMNMPVVTGFQNDRQLPPLVVVENLFLRIVADGAPLSEIDSTIAAWLRDVPKSAIGG
jgi:hypothetical protein